MRFRTLSQTIGIILMACAGFAQNPPAVFAPTARVSGTIESFDGQTLVIRTQDGQAMSVAIPLDLRMMATEKSDLAGIKPGDYVGAAAVEGRDGKLHAQEVTIFLEDLRGRGEGQRPMPADPGSGAQTRSTTNATVTSLDATPAARSMTNATVADITAESQGGILKLQYKGGEAEIEVAPDTPITRMVLADRRLLQPGVVVTVGTRQAGGGWVATLLNVQGEGANSR